MWTFSLFKEELGLTFLGGGAHVFRMGVIDNMLY